MDMLGAWSRGLGGKNEARNATLITQTGGPQPHDIRVALWA